MSAPTCTRRTASTWTQCGCPECTKSQARTRKLHAAGALPPTRSAEAWEEIDRLLGGGWTPGAIAASAGIADRTIIGALARRATNGTCTLSRVTAERILAHDLIPHHGRIPATPYVRRLRALVAIGWTLDALTGPTGQNITTLSAIARGSTVRILGSTARTIADAYDALAMRPGPSLHARRRAIRLGWVPPLAFDDIDDPTERPNLGATTTGFDLDEWARLVRWGEQPDRAAERCGVTLATVEKATYRKDRPDIRALTRRAVA